MNSNSSVSSVNLKELTTNLASLAQLESEVFASSPDQGFLDNLKLWRAGLFRIVVMGEIKQGKSSFINALLGVKDLVPVNSDVATSTIFKRKNATVSSSPDRAANRSRSLTRKNSTPTERRPEIPTTASR